MMKYRNKEVISDSEAKRFARNLCKKKGLSAGIRENLQISMIQ
jgi:hypothetical protein